MAQEDALAARIPLDGGVLSPLRWRLPKTVGEDAKGPLLAARRLVALNNYMYSTAEPARWFNTELSVEDLEPSDRIYKMHRDMEPQPWAERTSGPVWIWVMDIKKKSAGVVDVTTCLDISWTSKVRFQKNTRGYGGVGVNTLTVSLLDHYPDGKRWKVTDYNSLSDAPANRPYRPSCEAWGKTHTTTEGWTLPPESPDSVNPAP